MSWLLSGNNIKAERLTTVERSGVSPVRPAMVVPSSLYTTTRMAPISARCAFERMAALRRDKALRYSRLTMRAHFDPEVDIALLSLESGKAVSEEHDWGLIDRDSDDGHLMGFEIWDARKRLPPELVDALPTSSRDRDAA
jgi:uncharacterized protein YuzE